MNLYNFTLTHAISTGNNAAAFQKSMSIHIFMNLDWNGTANIKLKEITSTFITVKNPGNPGNMVVTSQSTMGDGKQTLQALNVTFGIGFRL